MYLVRAVTGTGSYANGPLNVGYDAGSGVVWLTTGDTIYALGSTAAQSGPNRQSCATHTARLSACSKRGYAQSTAPTASWSGRA